MISFIIELLAQISSLACDGHWLTLLCLKAAVKEVVLVVLCVPLYSSGEMVQHRLWRRRKKKKPGLLVRIRKLCEYEMRNTACVVTAGDLEWNFSFRVEGFESLAKLDLSSQIFSYQRLWKESHTYDIVLLPYKEIAWKNWETHSPWLLVKACLGNFCHTFQGHYGAFGIGSFGGLIFLVFSCMLLSIV